MRDRQLDLWAAEPDTAGEPDEASQELPAASSSADAPLPPLSDEQQEVLALESDLVVAAGAGSGKTRTLVELYWSLLSDPERHGIDPHQYGPSRILCLTFTERAARQIKERIRDRIGVGQWLRELEIAPITTFHAFCARVLRDHPLEAGIDPRFAVITEDIADDMLRQTSVETLRLGIERGDRAATTTVEIHGLNAAASVLAELVREARTAGWRMRQPIERFEQRIEELEAELSGTLPDAIDTTTSLLVAEARLADLTPTGRSHLEAIEGTLRAWEESPGIRTAEALRSAVMNRSIGSSWSGKVDRELRSRVVEALEACTRARREVDGRFQLGCWPALMVSVRQAYRSARDARRVLDYDDLLLRTRALFETDPDILESYRRRFRAVLVDEHQDTDPVQHDILSMILEMSGPEGPPVSPTPRWCVVGDANQSIYGFRGATVEAFEELADRADHRDARRRLAANYRSSPELIDFFNAFFPEVLTAGRPSSETSYEVQQGYRSSGGQVAVELIDPDDRRVPADIAREAEARSLAARLRAACDPDSPDRVEVYDEGTDEYRTARPGDVAVLLRKLTQVEPYRRALQHVGLPSVVIGSGNFYGRQEVFDCLNALEAALKPEDAIPLVGFLRSPMVGLADETIFTLVDGWSRRDGTSLRDRILGHDGEGIGDDARRNLDDAAAVLRELQERTDTETPGETLAWLVDRTGYAAIVDALPDRMQRHANLARLIHLANRAPQEGIGLLSEWTATLRRRVEAPPRDRDAALPEAGNQVSILSIHMAKGLEFPVVAVADIGSRNPSHRSPARLDPELGIGVKWWDESSGEWRRTSTYERVRSTNRDREEAEEARLLYVASTRARDRLILSAGTTGKSWLGNVRAFHESAASSELVKRVRQVDWDDRFRGVAVEKLELPPPPTPYLDPLPAGKPETSARELAAKVEGGAIPPFRSLESGAYGGDDRRRGVRGHEVLERFPIDPPPDFKLTTWLGGVPDLAEKERGVLRRFISDQLWPRLRPAHTVRREHPFRLTLPGSGTVAGTIDCLLEDEVGEWWVWDYKFGSRSPETEAAHQNQLMIYALAAATVLELDRVSGRLWYVDDGTTREFRWNRSSLASFERRAATALAEIGAD